MNKMRKIITYLLLICILCSLFPAPGSQAAEKYTVYGETVERTEDVFRYLEDFYRKQFPQAALRTRLSEKTELDFVKSLAAAITKDCRTDRDKADAIARWVDKNITYDTVASAYAMDALYNEKGNCVSIAMLMEELLRQSGIPAVIGTGWRGDIADMTKMDKTMFNQAGHAWCFAYDGGQWLLYDPLFGEFGISKPEYISKWYYLNMVDFVHPVYDKADIPLGSHKYGDYEHEIYYVNNDIYCYTKEGKPSDIGRLYVYDNNYLTMFSVNGDQNGYRDGLHIEARPEEDSTMKPGQVYRNGWLVGDSGTVHAYCHENGGQPSNVVMDYHGEPYLVGGYCKKMLLKDGQYRFQDGYLTLQVGYEGIPVEMMSEEMLQSFNAKMNVKSNHTSIISVKDGVFKALKPGYALINYEAQFIDDSGFLMGESLEVNVVNKLRQYNLKNYNNEKEDVTRIFGTTRFKTAYGIGDALKKELGVKGFDTIIIASGINFPDALAGSYLAAKVNAPILMTDGKADSSYTKELLTYIDDNVIKGKAGSQEIDIYILGGTSAVPEATEKILKNKGYTVKRLSGNTRFETNLVILEEGGMEEKELLVCTGKTFADSLSASASGLPILLLDPTRTDLNEKQKEFLKDSRYQVKIIGGTAAVSKAYENALAPYDTDGAVERISGASRYETSVKVAKMIFGEKAPETAVIAYAMNFPDGLCGGPLAYAMKAPLILTGPLMNNGKPATSIASGTKDAADYMKACGIEEGFVLGGSGALVENTVKSVFNLKNNSDILGVEYKESK